MDGIVAVTARIAEIRALMQSAAPATVGTRQVAATGARVAVGATAASTGDTFATVLQQAVGTAGTSSTASAGSAAAGMSVAELKAKFANGKIPPEALASIGRGGHRLAAPAASAFTLLEAAAGRDGIRFGTTDSYRSFEQQVDVAQRKGLYSQGGLAAKPGTSQHGWGLAVDLDLDSKAQAWMRANGERFGFVEDTPREPWHWTYKP